MKFKSIKITNFRQFSGENYLEFSTDEKKNLTIIHAMNGSGKTTLLQAFNWCLYGSLKLPNPDKLINETLFKDMAINEEQYVSVIIMASHEQQIYTIERKKYVTKIDDNKSRTRDGGLTITFVGETGNSIQENGADAENIINSILPEKLSSYFLFDGERIKNLGENTSQAKKDISTGIKNILNIDVYDSLKNVLEKKVLSSLNKQLNDSANEELDQLLNKLQNKLNAEELTDKKISQLETDIRRFEFEIEELEEKIRENSEGLKLQEEQNAKKRELKAIKEEINEMLFPGKKLSHASFSKFYTKFSLISLLSTIKEEVMINLNSSTINDDAIPGVNADAIDVIFEKKQCICGRKISPQEMKFMQNLKQYLPPHDHRVLIHGFKTRYEDQISNKDDIGLEKQQLAESYFIKDDMMKKLTSEINLLDRRLENVPDISGIYQEKKQKENALKQKNFDLGVENVRKDDLIKDIEKIRDSISLVSKKDEENKRTNEIIEYTRDLIKILNVTIEKRKKDIHDLLNKEVNNVFCNASHKKSKEVIIDIDYNYTIRDKYTGNESLSEGESIITSLSLIAAILKIAKNQLKAKNNELEATVEYPLILDAPFAKLDTAHISGIAPLLPKFSDQVILFSIDQQFKGAVENSVKDMIGKQYEMINEDDVSVYFKEVGEK